MNKFMVIGNATKNPEVRYTQGGMAVANLDVAVNSIRKGERAADFFRFTAFDKRAELIEKYVRKGNKVSIVAEVRNDNFKGKDGKMVYRNAFIVNEIEFLTPKNQSSGAAQDAPRTKDAADDGADDFMDVPDDIDMDEIPFM